MAAARGKHLVASIARTSPQCGLLAHTLCVPSRTLSLPLPHPPLQGDTGSGKSSQTPQYLLDQSLRAAAEARGSRGPFRSDLHIPPEIWGDEEPSIYVTQPRRVAAVTLAKRVASERGEEPGG